jgi:hypothetical protein
MKLQETNHSYYSSENNYYVGNSHGENYGRCEYDTWNDFKEEWLDIGDDHLGIDIDYNLCFRFDILQHRDEETDDLIDGYSMWLFFILQRKGIYRPVLIKNITDSDMVEVEIFLKRQSAYIKELWKEISE